MTDVQTHKYTFTEEQLRAKAIELGIELEQLQVPEYPDFRDEKGYRLLITDAKNITSPKGANQVELSLVALDIDGNPVKHAKGKLWLTYPFANEQFQFKDKDARERSQNDMSTLLRCTGNKDFEDYASVVKEGNKTHYYNRDGELMDKVAFANYKTWVRTRRMEELKVRMEDPRGWIDTEFYAQRKINEKDGTVYRNWQRISTQPMNGVEYIYDPARMLGRHNSDDDVLKSDDGEDLF